MLLTAHFCSQVHSRGHKLGDRLERRKVALTRPSCVAGAVIGVSLASCPSMSAAAVCEGGGVGSIFLFKETEAQRNRAASRRIRACRGPRPPAVPGRPLHVSFGPSLFLCLLFPSCFFTLVPLTGAAAHLRLCNRRAPALRAPMLCPQGRCCGICFRRI